MQTLGLDPDVRITLDDINSVMQMRGSNRRGNGQIGEMFTFHRQTEEVSEDMGTKCGYCEHVSIVTVNWVKKLLKLKLSNDQLIQNSIFSAMMMNNLINDLLDLGKLENNAF